MAQRAASHEITIVGTSVRLWKASLMRAIECAAYPAINSTATRAKVATTAVPRMSVIPWLASIGGCEWL